MNRPAPESGLTARAQTREILPPAAKLAGWWDEQKRTSEQALNKWVEDNPHWWAVGGATFLQTTMDLGAGLVDVLRLGEGAAEGGWRGYGKDTLRLLTILGPLGKAGGMLSRFLHIRKLRLAVTPPDIEGPCTYTAVNSAFSIVSGRARNVFLTARDAAAALRVSLRFAKEEGAWIDELVPFLRSQGARIKIFTHPTTVEEAAEIARNENGVVIFAIRYTTVSKNEILHSVIAVRDAFGRVRFGDYGGKLVGSLDELARNLGWGAPDANGISLAAKPAGAGATLVEGMRVTGLMEDAARVAKGAVLAIEGVTPSRQSRA
jgi:hypothetical protein